MPENILSIIITQIVSSVIVGMILYYAVHRREGARDQQIRDLKAQSDGLADDVSALRDQRIAALDKQNSIDHETLDKRLTREAEERRLLRERMDAEFVRIREFGALRDAMNQQSEEIKRLAAEQSATRAVLELIGRNIGIKFGLDGAPKV
jgi:hypothetical protein